MENKRGPTDHRVIEYGQLMMLVAGCGRCGKTVGFEKGKIVGDCGQPGARTFELAALALELDRKPVCWNCWAEVVHANKSAIEWIAWVGSPWDDAEVLLDGKWLPGDPHSESNLKQARAEHFRKAVLS